MKLIDQHAEILQQSPGLLGIYEAVAACASTCYKSAPKSGESAKDFVKKLIQNQHNAMLEFGTVYLTIPFFGNCESKEEYQFYVNEPHSRIYVLYNNINSSLISGSMYVTTNLRVLKENNRLDDSCYLCDITSNHSDRITFRLITSIAVARELTRHRVFSFAQESTRYCNYSKDKFGNELTFVIPTWAEKWKEFDEEFGIPYDNLKDNYAPKKDDEFYKYYRYFVALKESENAYMTLSKYLKPEEARGVLPLDTKTEICVCGFRDDWKHFFDLRLNGTTGKPHPDMQALAKLMIEKI